MPYAYFQTRVDMTTLDLSKYTGAHIYDRTDDYIATQSGKHQAQAILDDAGFIQGINGQLKDQAFFMTAGLHISQRTFMHDRHDAAAIFQDIFGSSIEINGSQYADTLVGAGGDDTLVGGRGGDELSGGAGADHFKITALNESIKHGADLITDLTSQDYVDLRNLGLQQHDIKAHYAEGRDLTIFRADADHDGAADIMLMAAGDHTASGSVNFLV